MDKVKGIKALNRMDLESLSQILMDHELSFAAGEMSSLRGIVDTTNLFLVSIGNNEWHSWHILNIDAVSNTAAVAKINKGQFIYVINGIPCTEVIDSWVI